MARGAQSFITAGLPMITMVVGGWLGISYVLEGKFNLKAASRRALELAPNNTDSLEAELAQLQERLDLDDYENKPLPRPKDR